MAEISGETFDSFHSKFQILKCVCRKSLEPKNTDTDKENQESCSKTEIPVTIDDINNTFQDLQTAIEDAINKINEEHETYKRLICMKISLMYEQAKTLVANNEEIISEKILEQAYDLSKPFSADPFFTFLHLRVINHFSYLLSKHRYLERARGLLEDAENVYRSIQSDPNLKTYGTDDLFQPDDVLQLPKFETLKLEKLVTNNLQMLGWIYNKLCMYEKFAIYNHMVLRRQLEMQDGNALSWALKTSQMAMFFLNKNKFKDAKHHLAAATVVLEEYERDLKIYNAAETIEAKWEEFNYHYGEVIKSWIKYGIYLFSLSKSTLVSSMFGNGKYSLDKLWTPPFDQKLRIIKSDEGVDLKTKKSKQSIAGSNSSKVTVIEKDEEVKDEDANMNVSDIPQGDIGVNLSGTEDEVTTNDVGKEKGDAVSSATEVPNEESQQNTNESIEEKLEETKKEGEEPVTEQVQTEISLRFPTLNVEEYENGVTCDLIETNEQARALFMYTHSWLKKLKMFITLKNNTLEYINSVLDLSELYRILAFYETSLDNQYNIQKRRSDALETLSLMLKETRPQCHLAVNIEIIRELAEVQLEMMGLNLKKIALLEDENNVVVNSNVSKETSLQKMEAVADIHAKLEQMEENLISDEQREYETADEDDDEENVSENKEGKEINENETSEVVV